jgi:transposase
LIWDNLGGGCCVGAERASAMISFPAGAQVWLATGHTDMRKGFDGLALLVQETLKRNPHNGHLFVFRGRSGGLLKVLWHDGQGGLLVRVSVRCVDKAIGSRPFAPLMPWSL